MRCGGIFDVGTRRDELKTLEQEAAAPEFWNDQNKAKKNIDQTNAIRLVLNPYDELNTGAEEADLLVELIEAEASEEDKLAGIQELETILSKFEAVFGKLELQSLLGGQFDANNAYLNLHAGAGGTESCDWADMLFRMYRRYAEKHGFDLTVLDIQPGDEAGIKSASFMVSGAYAFGNMKSERGVHRLVRISPFDSNSRRHTSFAALDVVAEVDDDIDVEIEEKDLRIDTYRASGAGGQHVNTTDSAVRITHAPTGIVVQCQAERSQHSNRAKCMKMLKSQLYEWELDQQRKEMEKFYSNKGEIAWGSQIRSYVFQPYTMVKDMRTRAETSNVQAVMDGDLDLFMEAYLKQGLGRENTK